MSLTLPPEPLWIAIEDVATAIGESRLHIDILRSLTQPVLRYRMDMLPRRRNRRLWHVGDMAEWLNYHLKLTPLQIERLIAGAREILLPLNDKGPRT